MLLYSAPEVVFTVTASL